MAEGLETPDVGGMSSQKERRPIIQVKNLYKIYRVGETKVYTP